MSPYQNMLVLLAKKDRTAQDEQDLEALVTAFHSAYAVSDSPMPIKVGDQWHLQGLEPFTAQGEDVLVRKL